MENKTKIVLTVIGLAALVVPAVLLVVFSGRNPQPVEDASVGGSRQLRQDAVQNEINKNSPAKSTIVTPSAAPSASPSALPTSPTAPQLEGTPASGVN